MQVTVTLEDPADPLWHWAWWHVESYTKGHEAERKSSFDSLLLCLSLPLPLQWLAFWPDGCAWGLHCLIQTQYLMTCLHCLQKREG